MLLYLNGGFYLAQAHVNPFFSKEPESFLLILDLNSDEVIESVLDKLLESEE